MIINDAQRTRIKTPPRETADYFVDPKNMAQVGLILQGMYSDPVLAVIREYTANAVDAHKQAGKETVPVIVRLPTDLAPTFEVQDEGPGLSLEDTKRLLLGYGASGDHKRASNNYIGGFGIGCKCALAIVDQFAYTIWHGGTKRIWSSYKDDHGCSKADLVFEEYTNDGKTGVLVSVPVADSMFYQFQQRVQDALRYFTTLPTVENLQNNLVIKTLKVHEAVLPISDNVTLSFNVDRNPNDKTVIVMGGVGYPIDYDKVFDGQMPSDRRVLVSRAVFHAPVGYVQLAPSREALQYTTFTRRRLQDMSEALGPTKLRETLETALSLTTGALAKAEFWESINERCYSSLMNRVAESVEKKHVWISRTGVSVNSEALKKHCKDYVRANVHQGQKYISHAYKYYASHDLVTMTDGNEFSFKLARGTRIALFDEDETLPTKKSIIYTLWKKLGVEDGTQASGVSVLLLQASNKGLSKLKKEFPWLSEVIEDPKLKAERMLESDFFIEPPDGEAYLLEHFRTPRTVTSAGGAATRTKVAVHSVTLVKMKLGQVNYEKGADLWETATIKLPELKGMPYVTIDKFRPLSREVFNQWDHNGTANLRQIQSMDMFQKAPVYGIRVRDQAKAAGYGLVPFEAYVCNWFTKEWPLLTKEMQDVVLTMSKSNGNPLYHRESVLDTGLTELLQLPGLADKEAEGVRKKLAFVSNRGAYSNSNLAKLVPIMDELLGLWKQLPEVKRRMAKDKDYLAYDEYVGVTKESSSPSKSVVQQMVDILRLFDLRNSQGHQHTAGGELIRKLIGHDDWVKKGQTAAPSWYLKPATDLLTHCPNLGPLVVTQATSGIYSPSREYLAGIRSFTHLLMSDLPPEKEEDEEDGE